MLTINSAVEVGVMWWGVFIERGSHYSRNYFWFALFYMSECMITKNSSRDILK